MYLVYNLFLEVPPPFNLMYIPIIIPCLVPFATIYAIRKGIMKELLEPLLEKIFLEKREEYRTMTVMEIILDKYGELSEGINAKIKTVNNCVCKSYPILPEGL